MNKYKAIGFDYGGVIGGVGSMGLNFTKRITEILGTDEQTYKDVYFSINYLINTGEIPTWREFWTVFLDKFGRPDKLEEVMTLSNKSGKLLEVVDDRMLQLVDELREKGFKTGLLSNTTKEAGTSMRANEVDRHFDTFHISAETKIMKPNPKAFQHLAEELGIEMRELIFVDDAEKSLSTAGECGFTPILFTSYEKLREKFKELRII